MHASRAARVWSPDSTSIAIGAADVAAADDDGDAAIATVTSPSPAAASRPAAQAIGAEPARHSTRAGQDPVRGGG